MLFTHGAIPMREEKSGMMPLKEEDQFDEEFPLQEETALYVVNTGIVEEDPLHLESFIQEEITFHDAEAVDERLLGTIKENSTNIKDDLVNSEVSFKEDGVFDYAKRVYNLSLHTSIKELSNIKENVMHSEVFIKNEGKVDDVKAVNGPSGTSSEGSDSMKEDILHSEVFVKEEGMFDNVKIGPVFGTSNKESAIIQGDPGHSEVSIKKDGVFNDAKIPHTCEKQYICPHKVDEQLLSASNEEFPNIKKDLLHSEVIIKDEKMFDEVESELLLSPPDEECANTIRKDEVLISGDSVKSESTDLRLMNKTCGGGYHPHIKETMSDEILEEGSPEAVGEIVGKEKLSDFEKSQGKFLEIDTSLAPASGESGVTTVPKVVETNREFSQDKCIQEACYRTYEPKDKTGDRSNIIPGGKRYECPTCKKKCFRKQDYRQHLLTHTGEKPFVCTTCEKEFKWRTSYRYHLLTHTGEKPFVCATCKKGFIDKQGYGLHLLTHTGKKPFACSTCKKEFFRKSSHRLHKCHTIEKPFVCTTCNRQFKLRKNYRHHLLSHSKGKPFTCNTCNKQFARKNYLRQHVLLHTSEKPFVCTTCKKEFKWRASYRQHMLRHANTDASR